MILRQTCWLTYTPVDYILFITTSVDLHVNENEVGDVKWVSIEELKALMNELDPDAFTPWFKLIVNAFLFPWWQELLDRRDSNTGHIDVKTLSHHEDDTIHRL